MHSLSHKEIVFIKIVHYIKLTFYHNNLSMNIQYTVQYIKIKYSNKTEKFKERKKGTRP